MIIAACKNSPTSTIFDVIKETEKAVQLRNKDIEQRHAFPVWVPKSMIAVDKFEVPAFGDAPAVTVERAYFKPVLWKLLSKPWQRVALGLSCY